MLQKYFKITIPSLLILQFLIYSCSSDTALRDREIRYISSRIVKADKSSITLQDGTMWGFSHFVINTPGDDVLVTYYESTIGGTIYINGIEQNVTYLGTTYSGPGSINDIIKFNSGKISYISTIDTTGTLISLSDSTNWIVHPQQRIGAKKWEQHETVILDSLNQLIVNPRLYQMISVRKYE